MFSACNSNPMLCSLMEMERRWNAGAEMAPKCPRCASPNTKFCYYNNYSLSQPRYFCKTCRRYWTKGGSLRYVPVGGGFRKRRHAKSSARYQQNPASSANGKSSSSSSSGPSSSSSDSQPMEIDVAAIFARFLKQNSVEELRSSALEMPNSANQESKTDDETMIRLQNPSEFLVESGFFSEIPQVLEGVQKQQELERLGEFEGDVIWRGEPTVPAFTTSWQPQDSDGTVQCDDQMVNNLINDNWGSLDLSSF